MSDTRHDLPLVVFTCLAIAGGGCIAAPAIAELGVGVPARAPMLIGLGLLGAGVAASLLHLGQPRRAMLAARGAGRSPLSHEVALALAALALGAAAVAVAPGAPMTNWMRAGAVATSLAFLVSIGRVYRIRGQMTWTGAAAWTPLSAGLLFGSLISLALVDDTRLPLAAEARLYAGALLCAMLDLALNLARWRWPVGWSAAMAKGLRASALSRWLLWRIVLLDLLPLALLLVERPVIACAAAAAGLIVDRVGFYATALHYTTEVEITRVEQLLDAQHPTES